MKAAEKSLQNIQFGDDTFEELLNQIENTPQPEDYRLLLFIGESDKQKKEALKQVAERSNREVQHADANELISENESVTREQLDQLFENFESEELILYINHGANLCGAYTGYTLSKVKYATPQERYLLKKLQQSTALVIVDFEHPDDTDRTLRRAANTIVTFRLSDNPLKQFLRNLKNIRVQGYQFNTQRPSTKGKTTGNF